MATTPAFQVTVGGADILATLGNRRVSLRLSSSLDGSADMLELELDDHAGEFAVPDPGRALKAAIGYVETGLVEVGTYVHIESVLDLVPRRMTLRASAADMTTRATWKTQRSTAWTMTTLGEIVRRLAERHGATASIDEDLARHAIAHVDQTAESDLHLLRRLADRYGASVQIQESNVVVTAAAPAVTAGSGRSIETIQVPRADVQLATMTREDRSAFRSIRARYMDRDTGIDGVVLAGSGEPVHELRDSFPDRDQAAAAAAAALARLDRVTSSMSLTLAGNPAVLAGARLRLPWWPQAAADTWSVTRAEHSITPSKSYVVTVECERSN